MNLGPDFLLAQDLQNMTSLIDYKTPMECLTRNELVSTNETLGIKKESESCHFDLNTKQKFPNF